MSITNLVLLSDQIALQRMTDIVANNIANSSTTGFKRQGIEFNTILSNLSNSRSPTATTSFVYDRSTYRDLSPGAITPTGNPLDIAIQGDGYFQVQTPTGTQYTRNGAFRLDNQGQIVTSAGYALLSDGGQPFTIPEDAYDLNISGDGTVTVQSGTGSSRTQLGKIGVVKFDNNNALSPAGNSLLTTTQTSTPVTGNPLVQGSIEGSNVQPVVEMTDLIRIQRAYEQAANMISQENSRLSTTIDKLSSTT